MTAQRRAEVIWENDLLNGNGSIKEVGSGAFSNLPLSWSARTEQSGGKTSPEELLAAAHASCFAMAFSATLARNKTPPQTLHVTAVCTFDKVGEGWKVTTMDLSVIGKVSGMHQAEFEENARKAEQGCPISNAIKNNVEIRLKAQIE